MTTRIDFDTFIFLRAHGRLPKKPVRWMFAIAETDKVAPFSCGCSMTWTEARKWAIDHVLDLRKVGAIPEQMPVTLVPLF